MKYQKLQTNVRTLLALVACAGAVSWAWRHVAESSRGHSTGDWIRRLSSGKQDERRLAIRSLQPTDANEVELVVAASTRALNDKDALVRVEAALALTQFATLRAPGSQTVDGIRGRRIAKTLLEVFRHDKDASVRATGATGLSLIYRAMVKAGVPSDDSSEPDPLKPEVMLAAFDAELSRDISNRVPLLDAIKRLGAMPIAAPPGLLGALDDKRYVIRGEALETISHFALGVDRAIPVLLHDVANNTSQFAPNYAGISAAMRPSPAAVPILIQAMGSDHGLVRETAARLLARVEPPASAAAPALIAAVKKAMLGDAGRKSSEDSQVREIRTSDAMRPRGGTPRQQPASDSVSVYLAIALAKLAAPEETVPLLVELMKRKSAASRIAAATGLGKLGPRASDAIPALIDTLKEAIAVAAKDGFAHDDVGRRTAEALGEISPRAPDAQATAKDVIAVLKQALKSSAFSIRSSAIEALGNFGPKAGAAIPTLREFLTGRDDYLRGAAESALKKIDPQWTVTNVPKA